MAKNDILYVVCDSGLEFLQNVKSQGDPKTLYQCPMP